MLIVVFMPIKIDEKPHLFLFEGFHLAFTRRCYFGVALGKGRSLSPTPQHSTTRTCPLPLPLEAVIEMCLKNMGRGWFPVFGLQISAEARLLSSLWAQMCVGGCAQTWASTRMPREGRKDIPCVCPPMDHISELLQQELSLHRRLCLSSQESGSKAHEWIFKQKALANLPGKCNKNVFLKKIHYQNDR